MKNLVSKILWNGSVKTGFLILVVLILMSIVFIMLTVWKPWYLTFLVPVVIIPLLITLIPIIVPNNNTTAVQWVIRFSNFVKPLLSSWKFQWACMAFIVGLIVIDLKLEVSSCAYKRYTYSSWIRSFSIQNPDKDNLDILIQAFTTFPYRPEPRALLRRASVRFRFIGTDDSDSELMKRYRMFFQSFINDEKVHNTAIQADHNEACTHTGGRDPIAPDIWYASLIPEGTGNTSRALEILEQRSEQAIQPRLAELLKLNFQVDYMVAKIARGNDDKNRDIVDNFQREANDKSEYWNKFISAIEKLEEFANLTNLNDEMINISSTHYYQEAVDRMGSYYILRCAMESTAENMNPERAQSYLENGVKWYARVLEIRDSSVSETEGNLWFRPPNKLAAYNGFLYAEKRGTPYYIMRSLFDKCKDFGVKYKDDITDPHRRSDGRYHKKAGWAERTIYELSDPATWKKWLEESLRKGWRYNDVFNAT